MLLKFRSCNLYAGGLLFLLSIFALSINFFICKYPGNLYFAADTINAGVALLLIWLGCFFLFGQHKRITRIAVDVFKYYLVLFSIAFATTAAQFTPFPPIDQHLVALEELLGIDMAAIVTWTSNHPFFKLILGYSYDSLVFQLAFIPLVVIATGQYRLIQKFYFFMLLSAVIGFTFYYFFPTTAPASIIQSPHFLEEQRATGLKFQQIHHYIRPTTADGGMIALPSFHVIWAWYCLYLFKGWPIAFALLLPVNVLLVMACVLLGWHYPIDILGSIVVILITYSAYRICQRFQI